MRRILTADDLAKGDLIEPGWWPAEVSDYDEKPAKSDASTNCIFDIKVTDGPHKGATIKRYLNEKGLEFNGDFWAALGLQKNAIGGYDLSTELFRTKIGSKFQIHVKRGKYEGRDTNEIDGYRPIGG